MTEIAFQRMMAIMENESNDHTESNIKEMLHFKVFKACTKNIRDSERRYYEELQKLQQWIPDDDISFDELFRFCNQYLLPIRYEDKLVFSEDFPIFAEAVFSQIKNTLIRKEMLAFFMSTAYELKKVNNIRETMKHDAVAGYDKNWQQKVRSNKNAAEQVLDSLIPLAYDERTETLRLLLSDYSKQCDRLLNDEPIHFRSLFTPEVSNNDDYKESPLSIKEYRLPPKRSKESLKMFLKIFYDDPDMNITELQIKQLLETINIQAEI